MNVPIRVFHVDHPDPANLLCRKLPALNQAENPRLRAAPPLGYLRHR